MTTDYETRLAGFTTSELLSEVEDARDALHEKPIAVDYERWRIVKRVLARRINLSTNLAP